MEDTNIMSALSAKLIKNKLWLRTAESCSGGGIAYLCTELPGSSQWFDRSYVTYSNEAKYEMLGVSKSTLEQEGAVSEEVARQMAIGAVGNRHDVIAVAVTGIAGPSGGTLAKPVGTVHFACCLQNKVIADYQLFEGDREQVRQSTITHALAMVQTLLDMK